MRQGGGGEVRGGVNVRAGLVGEGRGGVLMEGGGGGGGGRGRGGLLRTREEAQEPKK